MYSADEGSSASLPQFIPDCFCLGFVIQGIKAMWNAPTSR